MGVRVKICGITRAEDAIAAVDAGADLIGLNFYTDSPRYVGSVERAIAIRRAIDERAALAGVFVGATRKTVAEIHAAIRFDFVQVYGEEDESAIADLEVPIIRAIRLKPGASADQFRDLRSRTHAKYVLLDVYDSKLYGGTGKLLDLADLARFDLDCAFVAGGLNPGNVAGVARLCPYGVDVASGVESAPGIKDHDKLRSFIRNAKSSR